MINKGAALLMFTFSLMAVACNVERNEADNEGKQYVDIEGLVMSQVSYFSDEKATLVKTAVVDGEKNTETSQPDSTGWARELGFFRQIDMNKPAFRQAYDSTITSEEGMTRVVYDARFPVEVPVQKLAVTFSDRAAGKVHMLEAEFLEVNELYTTFRRMEAEFDPAEKDGLPGRLNRYFLEGGHKIIFRDSITYKIEGRIR
ncbi:MAG: hypothetical protein WBB45_08130 [Cyclobacteriaceae bacterium]